MKFFISKKCYPNTHFIYKVLFFFKKYVPKEELINYINEVYNYPTDDYVEAIKIARTKLKEIIGI